MNGPMFIVGATGVGKSAVAMELARKHHAAILSMDAMQVYRGADIGTGKPSAAERAEVPHGGLDLVEFSGSFDVARYLKHADTFLNEQREAGKRVIIVGGTGLYFRALTRGLCEAPQGSDELRAELAGLSVEALRERLRTVDALMLERVDAANPRRLARAIEVMESTGKSLLAWQEETPEPLVRDFQAIWIQRPKEELNARIETRVEAMFAQGWVEEARGLVEKFGMETVKAFAGIGYGQIAGRLRGKMDGITELTEFWGGEAAKLRGHGRSQMEFGNEGTGLSNEIAQTSAFPNGVWERGGEGDAPPMGSSAATTVPSPGGRRLPDEEAVKSDIVVTTRQYAKRQLTWFAREPKLKAVMLSGTQPFPADEILLP